MCAVLWVRKSTAGRRVVPAETGGGGGGWIVGQSSRGSSLAAYERVAYKLAEGVCTFIRVSGGLSMLRKETVHAGQRRDRHAPCSQTTRQLQLQPPCRRSHERAG